MFKVLVTDDDAQLRLAVCSALMAHHFIVDQAKDGEECVNRVRAGSYDLVLLDVHMPRLSGIEALREIRSHDPSISVIMLTAFSNVRDAVEATKQGAYNYLEKPIKAENLVCLVEKALRAKHQVRHMTLSAPIFKLPHGTDFIGHSLEMKKIFTVINKLSKVDTAVLIRGESGTGKELVAQALHFNSPRKDNRFVTINCSAIPENLIESEFFGHEKGAFTGADARKIGKFQYADGGTLFLDEIGDISSGMQVKLLRALQEKKFSPVGSNREVEVNLRIIAATNRNLEEMIRRSEFREDLFYRLNVLPILLPPLRERKNDIEALATYFIERFNVHHKKQITHISTAAMTLLQNHSWPGNIRELENVIEHAFVIENSNEITPISLPETINPQSCKIGSEEDADENENEHSGSSAKLRHPVHADSPVPAPLANSGSGSGPGSGAACASGSGAGSKHGSGFRSTSGSGFTLDFARLDFQANKEEFEKQFLISALSVFKGRINQTAIHANIPKKTLLRKLEKYAIHARDYS